MPNGEDFLEVVLMPGEFYFGEGNIRVSTLLGSCVSLTLWHPLRRHGGMCHYMLDSRGIILGGLDGKYADEALELFMMELKRHGTHPGEYEVKMFGGGIMFKNRPSKSGVLDIGTRNVEEGRRLLDRYGFRLARQHVNGYGHRRVMYDLWSGDVWVRFTETQDTAGVTP